MAKNSTSSGIGAPPDAIHSLFRLDGRVALITGAAAGLGFQIARGFAGFGAKTVVHGRDPDRVARAAAAIEGAKPLVFDLSDSPSMESSIASLIRDQGRIDILVCNAAIRDRREFLQTSATALREVLETNLVANFELARLVVPHMTRMKSGRIIFITSNAAHLGSGRGSTYASSKGALESLTRSLAVELGPHNICVNAISPGYFATEYNEPMTRDPRTTETVGRRVPLKRWGTPSEVIGAAVFLASPAGSYVSGQTIKIDGGLSVQA